MSLLSGFFRTSDHVAAEQETAPAKCPSLVSAIREFFNDDEVPTPKVRTEPASSRLMRLAAQDRTDEGRRAGQDHHDMNICRQMKERIKAEIMCALEQEVGQLTLLLDQLEVEIHRLQGGGMETTLRELQARHEQLGRHRTQIHEQQLLVPGNSGYAEWPLTSFETGFKQGYQSYLDSTVLINRYTR